MVDNCQQFFTLFHLLEFTQKIDKALYHAPFEVHGIYLENKFAYQIFWKKELTNSAKYGTMNT